MLLLPYLVWLSFKPKYKRSIPARFGCIKNPPFASGKIWMHGCSLGEIKSLEPLIDILGKDVHVSTITGTGFKQASSFVKEVRYLPFEIFLPFWVKKHDVLVVLEAELWLALFLCAKTKGAHTILLNARISERSFKRYLKFQWFYKIIFTQVDKVFAQTELDKERLELLGAKNITVNGNIKTALQPKLTKRYKKPQKRVITIASTHKDEEKLILQALPLTKDTLYCIVPRHPERFSSVDAFLKDFAKKEGLQYGKMSSGNFEEVDILLCDKMGELINLYAITDITILGGSFVPNVGGHNPLEPAFFKNVIISGLYTFNQNALFLQVENIYKTELKNLKRVLQGPLKASRLLHSDAAKPVIAYIKSKID